MMTSLLLAICLTCEWCWDPVVEDEDHGPAEGYKVYYSNLPMRWSACNVQDVGLELCDDGATPEPWDKTYYQVVAWNLGENDEYQESEPLHGEIEPCEGTEPVAFPPPAPVGLERGDEDFR